ncbi:hypothetical protein JGH11_04525 [Dysgonomonas sp. Marseille-P4677]|uniref:hypothetical protein n=1 Tax=Dysgonomonas sp. Marseille-P4677 TaxID=2364790 RepID=UPI001912D25C|nr:hypothetical protein [Dysgonomonas sp. Marseille-P4677]MBK5720132.1 hypothetical protein [Dysgonomonas sp. Marseille-P4677]
MNVEVTIKDLLTIYWSQTVLILGLFFGIIGYFGKRHFDLKAKKGEINYNAFQNFGMQAFRRYLDTFIDFKRTVSIAKDMTQVNESLLLLEKAEAEFSTFLDKKDNKILNEITQKLSKLPKYFNFNNHSEILNLVINDVFRAEIIEECEILVEDLKQAFRRKYLYID